MIDREIRSEEVESKPRRRSPGGIEFDVREKSRDCIQQLPIAHPLARARFHADVTRLRRRHRTVMEHALDINVPGSGQIRVEFAARRQTSATPPTHAVMLRAIVWPGRAPSKRHARAHPGSSLASTSFRHRRKKSAWVAATRPAMAEERAGVHAPCRRHRHAQLPPWDIKLSLTTRIDC